MIVAAIGGSTGVSDESAIVGVADHGGWAVLVTVASSLVVLDRCRVELKDETLPGLPHHDASRRLSLPETIDLVERVRMSARLRAPVVLGVLQERLSPPIMGIALRALPALPQDTAACIVNPWANARADGAMFRAELAGAATARGWAVHWVPKLDLDTAGQSEAFARSEPEAARRFAPPWNKDCRLALAAALSTQPLLALEQ